MLYGPTISGSSVTGWTPSPYSTGSPRRADSTGRRLRTEHTQLSVPSFLTSRYDGIWAASRGPTIVSPLDAAGVATLGIHSNAVIGRDFTQIAGFDELHDLSEPEWAHVAADDEDTVVNRIKRVASRSSRTLIERARPYPGDYEWARRLREAIVPDTVVREPTPYAGAELITEETVD
jgi:hypothetical protein